MCLPSQRDLRRASFTVEALRGGVPAEMQAQGCLLLDFGVPWEEC